MLLISAGLVFLASSGDFNCSLDLTGDLGAFCVSRGDEGTSFVVFGWGTTLGGFEGVFDSKADPFSILPKPPSIVPLFDIFFCEASGPKSEGDLVVERFSRIPPSETACSWMPPRLLTSLALRRPRIGPEPFSPGRSTATKLARTLLTGLLLLESSEGLGDRPRLGGEVD